MDKNTININKLPSKTWYWLHMNDTKVSWNPEIAPCKVTVEETFEDKETNSLISGDAAEFVTVESEDKWHDRTLTAKKIWMELKRLRYFL